MSADAGLLLNGPFENIRESLDNGSVSALALTEESLRRAASSQPELNAFITLNEETARQEARAADERLRAGDRHALLGFPIAIKDLILTRGQRTTAASKMLENFRAPFDATVITRLKSSGAPLIGKCNLDEFAMGSSNESSFFGPTKNPWDLSRVPGGSSGGSAAAVAARISPLSLGTDTGGSIRQPSSFCGVSGLKPTYGRVSRYGVVAFASSLDQVGPICSDALGLAATLETISGHDLHDATSSARAVPSFYREAQSFRDQGHMRSLRIGLPQEYFSEGLDAEVESQVREALEVCRSLGAEIVPISLPHTRFALPVYYLIGTSEASSNLARYDGVHYGHRSADLHNASLEELYSRSRREGFGEEVRLRILLGTYALSSGYYDAFYRKASQVRALIKKDFQDAFAHCDLIAGPTSPTTAFKLGEKSDDPLSMYMADVYTLSTNLAGLPGLSMNVGFDSQSLPIGLQLMSPWWEESRLLGVAALLEEKISHARALSPMALAFTEKNQ